MSRPKGFKLTEETKLKLSLAKTGEKNHRFGKHCSEETKLKISIANKGNKHALGCKRSEEAKLKVSLANSGHEVSEGTRLKIGLATKNRKRLPLTEETKRKMSEAQKGRPLTEEHKQKFNLNRAHLTGANHPNWKGGITPENIRIRCGVEFAKWRKAVYERDNYTCQKCGDDTGGNLNAHHIKSFSKYPELRFELSNGITYCEDCHFHNGFHKLEFLAKF